MSNDKRVKIHIGRVGETSRVLVDGKSIDGVREVRVHLAPGNMSTVHIEVFAKDCEIVQEDFSE